jgi:hypothetical protein
MAEVGTEAEREFFKPDRFKPLIAFFSRRRLFWIVLLVSLGLYTATRFWEQPSGGDRANWDYMAQVIARGGVPYRDAVNIKTPLSAYIGAAAITAGRPMGVADVEAIRVCYILLAAATVALTFLVASNWFYGTAAGLLAAAVMLSFHSFLQFNGGGVQPKTPMILFGLLSLWAAGKGRPIISGLTGMLSALSWQPGLLFFGTSALALSRDLTGLRSKKVCKFIAASLAPLVLTIAYFWSVGSLRNLYLWTIGFNATIYGPEQTRTIGTFFRHFGKVMGHYYAGSQVYFYLSIVGAILAIASDLALAFRSGRTAFFASSTRHAVILSGIIYFGFCMVNLQSGPDLIPLLPFVAVASAIALTRGIKVLGQFFKRSARINERRFEMITFTLIIGVVFYLSAFSLIEIRLHSNLLADQRAAIARLVAQMKPGDKIFVHGSTEVLVLGGLVNASPHFFLDRGKDRYLDRTEPGGFEGWLERLKAERPRFMILSRLGTVGCAADLEAWAADDYVKRQISLLDYYVRKDETE